MVEKLDDPLYQSEKETRVGNLLQEINTGIGRTEMLKGAMRQHGYSHQQVPFCPQGSGRPPRVGAE